MINAHLSGLRYWMFYWPILSAFIGIGTILFFITLVYTLSYLHLEIEEENSDESFEKSDIDDDKDLKTDCKSFYNISNSLVRFLYQNYKKLSFKVPNTSLITDFKDEEKSTEEEKLFQGGQSYIQEFSLSAPESSSSEVVLCKDI